MLNSQCPVNFKWISLILSHNIFSFLTITNYSWNYASYKQRAQCLNHTYWKNHFAFSVNRRWWTSSTHNTELWHGAHLNKTTDAFPCILSQIEIHCFHIIESYNLIKVKLPLFCIFLLVLSSESLVQKLNTLLNLVLKTKATNQYFYLNPICVVRIRYFSMFRTKLIGGFSYMLCCLVFLQWCWLALWFTQQILAQPVSLINFCI